jgi:hypothetical protein
MNERSPISRRKTIRGLGAGLVAAAASRRFAVERNCKGPGHAQKPRYQRVLGACAGFA